MSHYLFVGAHPDDIEISAMGWVLKLLRQGENVGILVLTSDRSTRSMEQDDVYKYLSDKYPKSFTFGMYGYWGNQELCGNENKIKKLIEDVIARNDIDFVVTHYPEDTHLDHRVCSRAVTDAARKLTTVYFESVNCRGFVANLYIEIDKSILEEKMELVKMHNSQIIKNDSYFLRKVTSTAYHRGAEIYKDFAEAFHILRKID